MYTCVKVTSIPTSSPVRFMYLAAVAARKGMDNLDGEFPHFERLGSRKMGSFHISFFHLKMRQSFRLGMCASKMSSGLWTVLAAHALRAKAMLIISRRGQRKGFLCWYILNVFLERLLVRKQREHLQYVRLWLSVLSFCMYKSKVQDKFLTVFYSH